MESGQYRLVAEIDDSHWWFVGRRRIMRDVLADLAPTGGARPTAVDVGCGPGATIAALEGDYETVGIDISEDAIALAEERFPATTYIQGLAPGDLPDGGRDTRVFLLMDVLEHVEDDRSLLASIVDVAPAGAVVFITVPADEHLWSEQDVRLGHHRRYDAAMLRECWAGLPVEELLLSPFNARLYPVIRGIRTLSRLTGRAWGDEGSDMKASQGPVNRLLTRLFAGEASRLRRVHRGEARPYRRGVSLMAVLEVTG